MTINTLEAQALAYYDRTVKEIQRQFQNLSLDDINKIVCDCARAGKYDAPIRCADMRSFFQQKRKEGWSTEQVLTALRKKYPYLSESRIKAIMWTK